MTIVFQQHAVLGVIDVRIGKNSDYWMLLHSPLVGQWSIKVFRQTGINAAEHKLTDKFSIKPPPPWEIILDGGGRALFLFFTAGLTNFKAEETYEGSFGKQFLIDFNNQ